MQDCARLLHLVLLALLALHATRTTAYARPRIESHGIQVRCDDGRALGAAALVADFRSYAEFNVMRS